MMCYTLRAAVAAAALSLWATAAAGQPESRPRTVPDRLTAAVLDSIIESARAEFGVPGISVAVIDLDGNLLSAAGGVRIMGFDAPVTPRDRFHIASVTKPMTATLIATYVQEGRLQWSTTPAQVFPEWADSIHPSLRGITLERLLSHTAGIQAFTDGAEYDSLPPFPGTPAEQRRGFARYLLTRAPASQPGGRYEYSNAGFELAAAMLERVAARPLEELMAERVWRPLSITTAGYGWPARNDPAQPWGHYTTEIGQLPHPPRGGYALRLGAASGDVHMTMEDLARFLHLHLQGLRGNPRLLTAQTFARMHAAVAPAEVYGLGWGRFVAARRAAPGDAADADGYVRFPVHFHTGGTVVFYTVVYVSPTRDVAIAVSTNSYLKDAATRVIDAVHARFR
jgi:CubicO group peptidase (beta-lactamase class C family)